MKVLLTGAAGFIGSHIADALIARGHEVVGLDNLSNGLFKNMPLHKNFDFQLVSLPTNLMYLEGITHICHQAAYNSVPRSIESPDDTIQGNVGGLHSVLEFARLKGIKRVVYASSSSIYGKDGLPQSPYAWTKQVNETQGTLYRKQYGMECIGLRYFNVFGPRQISEGPYAPVIPRWIRAIYNGEPIQMNGDGKPTRDFTYIQNVVNANLKALEMDLGTLVNPCYDIGCGAPIDLETLALAIGAGLKKPVKINYSNNDPGAWSSCARKFLGITEVNLKDGLDKTIKAFLDSQATSQCYPSSLSDTP